MRIINCLLLLIVCSVKLSYAQSRFPDLRNYNPPKPIPQEKKLNLPNSKKENNSNFGQLFIGYGKGSFTSEVEKKRSGDVNSFFLGKKISPTWYSKINFTNAKYNEIDLKKKELRVNIGYSPPVMSSHFKPYVEAGIGQGSYKSNEGNLPNESFNSLGFSIGTKLMNYNRFSLGINYNYSKDFMEKYEKNIKSDAFMINFRFNW